MVHSDLGKLLEQTGEAISVREKDEQFLSPGPVLLQAKEEVSGRDSILLGKHAR